MLRPIFFCRVTVTMGWSKKPKKPGPGLRRLKAAGPWIGLATRGLPPRRIWYTEWYSHGMVGLWWDYDGMGCMIHSCMDIIRSMCLYIILMIWINMIFIRFIDVGNLGYSRVISEALEISIEKKFLKGWVWHILTAFFWWLDAFGPFGELPNLNIDGVRKSDHHLWPGQLRSLLSWLIHPSLGRSPNHCPVSHVFKSWK